MPKASGEKPIAVIVALIANVVIAISKYVAALLTGSSSMLSEAFHSTADAGNEALLYFGLRRSTRPPDDEHPFGHGREVYFWSLIVATMLFSTGAGSAIYEGVTHLGGHAKIQSGLWNYVVLGIAAVSDGISWVVSYRKLKHGARPGEGLWENLTTSKDPSIVTVFSEDSADLAGIALAFFGNLLSQVLHTHLPDVIASILIGLVLICVAAWLAYESRSLLIGERADRELVNAIRTMVSRRPDVAKAARPLTMHLGPDQVLLCLDIQFRSGLRTDDVINVVDDIEHEIQKAHPSVSQVFIEAERLSGSKGSR